MKQNEYSPQVSTCGGKDTDTCLKMQAVRKLFLSGGKFTAGELNRLAGCNDARKYISRLRAGGWEIADYRKDNNACKVYWLVRKGGAE